MPDGESVPRVGETFNPFRAFNGVFVPDPVLRTRELRAGAKLAYGVLTRYAGRSGSCWPAQSSIAERMAVTPRQVRDYLDDLTRAGFIRHQKGGRGRSNRYHFLWHPSFEEAVRTGAPVGLDRNNSSTVDRNSSSAVDRNTSSSDQSQLKESHLKTENRDSDYLLTHRKKRDAQAEPVSARSPDGWKTLSETVQALIGKQPTQSGLGRIASATPNKTGAEAVEAIQEAVQRGYGAESKHKPRSVSWFVSTVRNYWADRERRALPAAAPRAGLDPDGFNRMLDAIEIPDAA
jgi:hypothetical protein